MKKYTTPELNLLVIQSMDIITLSATAWDDSKSIIYDKDNLSIY